MSSEVKGLTDVVKSLDEIKQSAPKIAEELRKHIAEVSEALRMTQEVSTALRNAGAELRGVLGTQTNNPPADE